MHQMMVEFNRMIMAKLVEEVLIYIVVLKSHSAVVLFGGGDICISSWISSLGETEKIMTCPEANANSPESIPTWIWDL